MGIYCIFFICFLCDFGIFYYRMAHQFHSSNRKILDDDTNDSLPFAINTVSDIDELTLYKQIERPNLKNEKLKNITDQLQLDKKARQSFLKRQFHGNYMFNYDVNPFTEEFKIENDLPHLPQKTKKKSNAQIDYDIMGEPVAAKEEKRKDKEVKTRSILDELRKYQNKKVEIRENMSQQLRDMMLDRQKTSIVMQQQVPKMNMAKKKASPKKEQPKSVDTKAKRRKLSSQTQQFSEVMDFEQIVQMRDRNYYLNTENIDNLFKFLTNVDLIHSKGKAILDSYYFCHNSMKDIVQKRKVLIYRDISRFARHLILEIQINEEKANYLHMNETNPNLETFDISMIFSISAGRTKNYEMNQFLLDDIRGPKIKEDEITTATQNEHEIDYPENTVNYMVLKEESQENHDQALSYLSMPFEEKEKRFQEILLSQFSSYKRNLVEERLLISMNINDRALHASIRKRGEQQLAQMLEGSIFQKDKERLIRRNKVSKDRIQQLRIKHMTQILKSRNQHNKAVQSITKSKSRSKTPTPRLQRLP